MEQYNRKSIGNELEQIQAPENDAPKQQLHVMQVEHNPYLELEEGLKKIFGNEFDLGNSVSQSLLLKHLMLIKEQNERLSEAFERDPRLAQMIVDMLEGKRYAYSAVARYFGNSYVNMDEDSPEYEEMLMADEERRAEVMRLADDRREYERNLKESILVIESFCKERGYDVQEFVNNVWECIIFPIMQGRYTDEVCTALDHAISYEQDVQDAFAAGDIKGRNMNIQRMKEDFGDGMPKGMGSVAPPETTRRKGNSLIEKALDA